MVEVTYASVNEDILRAMEPPKKGWWLVFYIALILLAMGAVALWYQIVHGLEVSGINNSIHWGFYITNFVFWVEIGHAGTLISAVLYLVRAPFRTSVYRISEAMTVFAIMTAGLFPLIHLGRIWNFYWLIPYPNQRHLWVNFKSPLLWDVFGVATYISVSMSFFMIGLIPDMAVLRDETKGLRRFCYSLLAFRFRGTNHQWLHYMRGYLLCAAIATPLVFSVATIVSWDFAMSSIPGWHSTIFGPYFLAGAIFSGCAMLLTIIIPVRAVFPGFKNIIKIADLEGVAKLVIFMGTLVAYSYLIEFFMAYYSGNQFEKSIFWFQPFGEYKLFFFVTIFCILVVPLLLWFKKVRTHIPSLFVISIVINIGMWLERFNIIVISLAHSFDPHMWRSYHFEWGEIWITLGSFGWFFMWFLLFIKIMPSLAICEVKETLTPPKRRS